jgi:hypothetical protein
LTYGFDILAFRRLFRHGGYITMPMFRQTLRAWMRLATTMPLTSVNIRV